MAKLTRIRWIAIWIAMGMLGCCKESPQLETTRGLQEENKVQKEKITQLENDLTSSRQQWSVDRTTAGRDAEDRTARLRQDYESMIKAAEAETARVRLELNEVRKERLVLRETLEQRPRLVEAVREGVWVERVVWLVLLAVVTTLLILVVQRYRSLQDRLRPLFLAQIRHTVPRGDSE